MNTKLILILTGICLIASLVMASAAATGNLLRNGDFNLGEAEERAAESFFVPGWRRTLFKPTTLKLWLTNGKYDGRIGKENQALVVAWDATSIYQNFSAAPGSEYLLKCDTMVIDGKSLRWEARIRVAWYDENRKQIGKTAVVTRLKKNEAPSLKWALLSGKVQSPANTAYGRILLDLVNSGSGQYFQRQYIDNVSVTGKRGTANMPASFLSEPYDLHLKPVVELSDVSGDLNQWVEDGNGDKLTFSKVSGPDWLKVNVDGSYSGRPQFKDVGENHFTIKADDGRGGASICKVNIPVTGLLRIANVFSENMVLQRGHDISVWGKALPKTVVKVKFNQIEKTTESDASGNWSLTVPSMKSGGGALVVVSGPRKVTLRNILVGDVWLCAGQSNMAWKMGNLKGAEKTIQEAVNPKLRFMTSPDTQDKKVWSELKKRAQWWVCNPQTVKTISATGYYFGAVLQPKVHVPIGLISSNHGGTRIETWVPSLNPPNTKIRYNSMIAPYTKLPIKGMIWYQGESNISDGAAYTAKLQALAKKWRAVWNIGDFPIYLVQLAPHDYRGKNVYQLPEIWAAQAKAADVINDCGMVVINDIGNIQNIHPQNKAPVGARLARLALRHTYGEKKWVPTGPIARSVTKKGASLVVRFDYSAEGLSTRDRKPLTWFEIAGADGRYVKAKAVIQGDSVSVSAPEVKVPQSVRFAWHETAEPNLINSEKLQAGAFKLTVK